MRKLPIFASAALLFSPCAVALQCPCDKDAGMKCVAKTHCKCRHGFDSVETDADGHDVACVPLFRLKARSNPQDESSGQLSQPSVELAYPAEPAAVISSYRQNFQPTQPARYVATAGAKKPDHLRAASPAPPAAGQPTTPAPPAIPGQLTTPAPLAIVGQQVRTSFGYIPTQDPPSASEFAPPEPIPLPEADDLEEAPEGVRRFLRRRALCKRRAKLTTEFAMRLYESVHPNPAPHTLPIDIVEDTIYTIVPGGGYSGVYKPATYRVQTLSSFPVDQPSFWKRSPKKRRMKPVTIWGLWGDGFSLAFS